MAIKGIVCIGAQGVMGNKGAMPWGDKPLDGKHFRSLTEGHTVVMGRRTYDSMNGRLLPNRRNIVLSRNELWGAGEGWLRAYSINPVLRDAEDRDVWVIGGANVFEAFLPYIEEMYVTTVGDEFEGDTYFPDMFAEYIWNHELLGTDEKDGYMLHFRKFVKVMKKPEPAPKQERGFLL